MPRQRRESAQQDLDGWFLAVGQSADIVSFLGKSILCPECRVKAQNSEWLLGILLRQQRKGTERRRGEWVEISIEVLLGKLPWLLGTTSNNTSYFHVKIEECSSRYDVLQSYRSAKPCSNKCWSGRSPTRRSPSTLSSL